MNSGGPSAGPLRARVVGMKYWDMSVEAAELDAWAADWVYEDAFTLAHVDGLRLVFQCSRDDQFERRAWVPDFEEGSVQAHIETLLARGVDETSIRLNRMVPKLLVQGRLLFIHRPPGSTAAPALALRSRKS